MNCWYCNTKLIWNNDFDIDDVDDDYSLLTTLSCPKCDSLVETYLPREQDKERKEKENELSSS